MALMSKRCPSKVWHFSVWGLYLSLMKSWESDTKISLWHIRCHHTSNYHNCHWALINTARAWLFGSAQPHVNLEFSTWWRCRRHDVCCGEPRKATKAPAEVCAFLQCSRSRCRSSLSSVLLGLIWSRKCARWRPEPQMHRTTTLSLRTRNNLGTQLRKGCGTSIKCFFFHYNVGRVGSSAKLVM